MRPDERLQCIQLEPCRLYRAAGWLVSIHPPDALSYRLAPGVFCAGLPECCQISVHVLAAAELQIGDRAENLGHVVFEIAGQTTDPALADLGKHPWHRGVEIGSYLGQR